MLGIKKPTMFCGESGTAKTVTVQSAFQGLEIDKYTILGMNFSSRTSSMDFQSILEENLDKKTFKNYGPKANGKKMIVFIDDMNMPRIDTYGTQQPLALAHFLIGKNQLYQRGGDLELREIIDTQYVGCISPVASGGNRVDPRVITLFSCFNVTAPSKESTLKIYDSILDRHCEEFSDEVKQIIPKITMATYTLYENIKEKMPRTPVKFHYIFNLRDFSKVYEGLLQMTIDKFNDKAKVIRLWRNEVTRVFGDRLISIDDKNQIEKIEIPAIIKDMFKDVQEAALADPLLYGDFSMASPTDDEVEDPRLYEDLNSFVYLKEKLDKMLEDYGFDHKPMSLVLFNDALEHVTRIHRIIRF
jgi:dynein heavy chain